MSIVTVRDLVKQYPAFRLNEATFSLEPGRITGFIGRNGAGKSTTIKAMLNLVHADSGEIRFFDLPLQGHEAEIKKQIGYSTGAISWYPRKKIRELAAVTKRFYDNWDEEAYRRYLALFALDEEKTPLQLSEGMKVKYNLLCALSHRAKLLILDEPTSGLDPFSRDELLGLFRELKNDGVAVFFSTHIISDLESCADDLIYISGGTVKAAGTLPAFTEAFSREGETLEQTFLRLERGENRG